MNLLPLVLSLLAGPAPAPPSVPAPSAPSPSASAPSPSAPSADAASPAPDAPARSRFLDVDPAAAEAWLAAHPETIVLDVRTPEEHAAGTLAGARLMDWQSESFATEAAALDPAATYLVYCRSGGRSRAASDDLKARGFTSLLHLEGGIEAWKDSGRPVVSP